MTTERGMMRTIRRSRLSAGVVSGLATLFVSGVATAQPSVPEPPPPTEPWYEAVQLRAFADGYYNANWGFPKPQGSESRPATRLFDSTNGFALAWVGLDAAYDPDPVGGVVSLRFGPNTNLYAGADANSGLQYVKQAYATWKPGGAEGMFTLDFGKFDTIYGAEVADSQDNFNYTRGIIYNLAQPHFHTGLRATAELLPELSLVALAVNGWNNSVDNNVGKTFGLQAHLEPSDGFSAGIGWLGGPEQDDSLSVSCAAGTAYDAAAAGCAPKTGAAADTYVVDRGGANKFKAWRHLIDLVVTAQPTDRFAVVLNGDYGLEGVRPDDTSLTDTTSTARWYGGALLARYQLSEVWGVAVRGEYLRDKQGRALSYKLAGTPVTDAEIATATLTVDARPTDNLIIRLENRGDFMLKGSPSKEIFREHARDMSSKLMTTTLGVVVTTN